MKKRGLESARFVFLAREALWVFIFVQSYFYVLGVFIYLVWSEEIKKISQ